MSQRAVLLYRVLKNPEPGADMRDSVCDVLVILVCVLLAGMVLLHPLIALYVILALVIIVMLLFGLMVYLLGAPPDTNGQSNGCK